MKAPKIWIDTDHSTYDWASKQETYKVLSHNLLQLRGQDNAIKSRRDHFDLQRFLSAQEREKVLNSADFNVSFPLIPFEYKKAEKMVLELSNDWEELQANPQAQLFAKHELAGLASDFVRTKRKLLNQIRKERNELQGKWKSLIKRHNDEMYLRDVWKTHVCYGFVNLKVDNRQFLGPLFLKKIEVVFKNNRITLKTFSEGETIQNEKMFFLLRKYFDFGMPRGKTGNVTSLQGVLNEAQRHLTGVKDQKRNLNALFRKKVEVTESGKVAQWVPGLTVGFLNPGGYELRNQMLRLIVEKKIEDLIEIDPLQDFVGQTRLKTLQQPNIKRISQLDFSQEQAVVAAMEHPILIQGPPGTGKSETIANIIANLMANGKRTLISSNKRIAIEVLLGRLKDLKWFTFLHLEGKLEGKQLKTDFYNNLKKWMGMVGFVQAAVPIARDYRLEHTSNSFFSQKQKQYFAQAQILENKDLDTLISVYKHPFTRLEHHPLLQEIRQVYLDNEKLIRTISRDNLWKNLKKHLKTPLKVAKEWRWGIFPVWPKKIQKLLRLSEFKRQHNLKDDYLHNLAKLEAADLTLVCEKLGNLITQEAIHLEEYANHRLRKQKEFDNNVKVITNKMRNHCQQVYRDLMSNQASKKLTNAFFRSIQNAFYRPERFVRKYRPIIKAFFPVLLATPDVLGKLLDFNRDHYDYIVFDEASQLRCEKALPFLGNVKKLVVAGDKQQLEPISTFEMREQKTAEDDKNEEDVKSFLEYCQNKGFNERSEYMLTNNYRSKAFKLMQFSSQEFYDNKLKVLDHNQQQVAQVLEVFEVDGATDRKKVNELEGNALLSYAINHLDFNKSVLIVTINTAQKLYIEQSLEENPRKYAVLLQMLRKRKLKIWNLENVQGDEADYVLISVTYTKENALYSTYLGNKNGRKALNVVVSRAKEKMVVFKSIKAADVKTLNPASPLNTFRKWLFFLEKEKSPAQKVAIPTKTAVKTTQWTGFQKSVWKWLLDHFATKFLLKSNYNLGTYQLDFAIIDKTHKHVVLGIKLEDYQNFNKDKIIDLVIENDFLTAKGYLLFHIGELTWWYNSGELKRKMRSLIKVQDEVVPQQEILKDAN